MGAGPSGSLVPTWAAERAPSEHTWPLLARQCRQWVGRGYRVKPACHAHRLLLRHLAGAYHEVAPLGQPGAVAALP